MKKKYMKASEFDALFDAGESTVEYLDKTKMKRPGLEQRRITVDFPAWMVHQLDKEAIRKHHLFIHLPETAFACQLTHPVK